MKALDMAGVLVVNEKVAPPFVTVGEIEAEDVEEMAKSLVTAVVAPVAPDTLITHEITPPVR